MIDKKYYNVVRRTIIDNFRSSVKNYVYTIRNGLAKGLKREGGLGFIPQLKPLTPEERWFLDLDLNNQTVYDIGGFEGVFTLFFARAVGKHGKVITFEPHPENYMKICKNVYLNNYDNVIVRNIALGKAKSKGILTSRHSDYGTASMCEEIKIQILLEKGSKKYLVIIDTLDDHIKNNNLPLPDFVKIDVEGFEFEVLQGMRETLKRCKPNIFIEIHDIFLNNAGNNLKNIIDYLVPKGYSVYHIESKNLIGEMNLSLPKKGHFYFFYN